MNNSHVTPIFLSPALTLAILISPFAPVLGAEPGWILYQNSCTLGDFTVHTSDTGARWTFPKSGLSLIIAAPKWNPILVHEKNKSYFVPTAEQLSSMLKSNKFPLGTMTKSTKLVDGRCAVKGQNTLLFVYKVNKKSPGHSPGTATALVGKPLADKGKQSISTANKTPVTPKQTAPGQPKTAAPGSLNSAPIKPAPVQSAATTPPVANKPTPGFFDGITSFISGMFGQKPTAQVSPSVPPAAQPTVTPPSAQTSKSLQPSAQLRPVQSPNPKPTGIAALAARLKGTSGTPSFESADDLGNYAGGEVYLAKNISFAKPLVDVIGKPLGLAEMHPMLKDIHVNNDGSRTTVADTIKCERTVLAPSVFRLPANFKKVSNEVSLFVNSEDEDVMDMFGTTEGTSSKQTAATGKPSTKHRKLDSLRKEIDDL